MIDRVELRTIHMKLVHPFETSFGRQYTRDVLLVAVHEDGVQGWGESVAGDDPFYSSETTETAWYVLKEFLIPALLEGRISGEAGSFYSESAFVRGHNMARAGLEAALWDLKGRKEGVPLYKLFGGERTHLPTGISLGIEPRVEDLLALIGKYKQEGYQRIKIKIKHGWDVDVVARIREELPDVPLMVDANCAYSIEDADHLARFDEHKLMMIEQPFSYEDITDHAKLQRRISTPVCLDESIKSVGILRAAIELGSCRIVNIKQGRVGGPTAAIRVHDLCRDHGIPVWCGGMLESGIGRLLNIHLASLENFTIPGDISASDRYWEEDIIDPPVVLEPGGRISVPQGPGIGHELKPRLIEKLTEAHEIFDRK
ncbi:MAG TPA: o-succinylbenzoate synthase [Acidobacteriota bacterium]|nr:o-succinylbenzoate synthase [Acidobacteriota bacterium]